MENKKKINIGVTDVILAVLGILFLVGIRTFFAPCGPMEDGGWMHCHQAGQAVTVVAAVLLALALVHLFVPKGKIKVVLDVLVIAASVLAIMIPGHIISLCMMPEMRCRSVMTPCTIVLSVLMAVTAVVDLILQRKKG